MSVDLDLKLTKEILVSDLVLGTQKVLKEIINLPDIPALEAKHMIMGVRYKIDNSMFLRPHTVYYVNFQGMEENVGLVTTELELLLPYITHEEAGQYLGITVEGGYGYPVKPLIAGAIALYVARVCGTKIFDERRFWSRNRENDADSFLAAISTISNYPVDNIQTASQKFYESLEGSKFDSGP